MFCQFLKNKILKIIYSVDSTRGHGHIRINICVLKICGKSVHKTLDILYKTCLESDTKNANIVSVLKEGDKQTIKT